MNTSPSAVVLLSGGLDSATAATIAIDQGFRLYALSVRYGQRHVHEIAAAKKLAQSLNVVKHLILDVDLAAIGGSALTSDLEVPKRQDTQQIGDQIPVTYVPARNTVFLSLALAWSEVIGTGDIFIGVNALDYSGYPDCRQEYISAYQKMANLATKKAVEGTMSVTLHTPLIHLSKSEIIRRGLELGVDYGLTTSCYDPTPSGLACGKCDACLLRLRGFSENGITDPTRYVDT